MKRPVRGLIYTVVTLLLLIFSVRVERLDERRARIQARDFSASDYASDFWNNRLPTVFDEAVDVSTLIRFLNEDMEEAIKKGQTLGESRVHAYLLQGSGRTMAVEKGGISLRVSGGGGHPEVLLLTGPFVSGNAIRDASGLVDVSAFTDTMKFNRISSEINNIVVRGVIRPFMESPPSVGSIVHFVGATEVAEDATGKYRFGDALSDELSGRYYQLKVIPIRVSIESNPKR